jgi:hypothetical protein
LRQIIAQTDSVLVTDTIPQYTHEAVTDSNLPLHYQFHWEDRISRMRRFNKFSYLFVQYGINIQGIFPGIRYIDGAEYSLPVQGFYIRPMYLNIELGIHIKNHRLSIGTDLQQYIYGFNVVNLNETMERNISFLHYLRRYYITYGYQFFHHIGWFIFTPGISLGFTDQFQSFFSTNNSSTNYGYSLIDSSFFASYSLGYDIKQSFVIAPMLDFTFQPGRIFAFFVNLSLPMSTDATYVKGSYIFQGETTRPIHAINSIRSINMLIGGRLKFYFPKELDKARKPKNQ